MGVYNCRVRFTNACPSNNYPVIGRIHARFTYYNGDTSVSQQGVMLRPGDYAYLFSRVSDAAEAECVEKIEMTMSWLYQDGSADSATVTDSLPHGQCRLSTGCELDVSSQLNLGFKGANPPVQVSLMDSTAQGGRRIVWASELMVSERQKLEEMKDVLLKGQAEEKK